MLLLLGRSLGHAQAFLVIAAIAFFIIFLLGLAGALDGAAHHDSLLGPFRWQPADPQMV
jgi:hypothetical protein